MGTPCHRACARSQGKLQLPTPTKSVRSWQDPEQLQNYGVGFFSSSYGARAWQQQVGRGSLRAEVLGVKSLDVQILAIS